MSPLVSSWFVDLPSDCLPVDCVFRLKHPANLGPTLRTDTHSPEIARIPTGFSTPVPQTPAPPAGERYDLELEPRGVPQSLHRHRQGGAEHGDVPPLQEVWGEGRDSEVVGVGHLHPTAAAQDRVGLQVLLSDSCGPEHLGEDCQQK